MKLKPQLCFILLLFSCIYHPPQNGKEILIHNQTDRPIVILDSLTGNLKLYDTATVNNRRYISREPNYLTEYGIYPKFYSEVEMNHLNSKNKITLYILDTFYLSNTLSQVSSKHLFRSFDINIDTLKKYNLNHLFINDDTIFFEHDYNYYTNRN
jgi:hypothetical protein